MEGKGSLELCAIFVAAARRAKTVVAAFLGDHRPPHWISDRYGGQMGWARLGHQVCLAHLIRDVQYAIDAGDTVLAPGLKGLLKRACAIGRRRARQGVRDQPRGCISKPHYGPLS